MMRAHESPTSAPQPLRHRALRAARHPALALLLALGLGLGAGCASIKPEVRRSMQVLPLRIEGIAVLPIDGAPGIVMNGEDREFVRQQIRARIDTHVPIKSFDKPPNTLPGIAVLKGRITAFRSEDMQGEQLYLRTVEVAAEFELSYQASEDPPRPFQRAFSYQKVYVPGQQVAAEIFDVQNALIEFSALVDAEFYPSTDLDQFEPRTARDPDSGEEAPTRMLALANQNAAQRRYGLAETQWRMALYEPNGHDLPRLYKVTRLSLGLLREEGVPEDVLKVLEKEFVDESPEDFVSFRDDLRDELGGPSPYEDRIGELSDHRAARAHQNLAAAHLNLARLARAQRQLDLAEYHFAMTWAHTRDPDYLERWREVQEPRRLIPPGLSAAQAIRLYLSIAPPGTARNLPGPFDETVLPPSPVRALGIRALILRAGGVVPEPAAEELAPIEVQVQPVPLEPAPPAGKAPAKGATPGAGQAAARAAGPAAPAAPVAPRTAAPAPPAPQPGGGTPAPAAPPVPLPLQELPPPEDVPLEAAPAPKR